ncbi:MalY/PatB family protein [Subtercola sp. YIM 133946]|uniref:MalY/PatB family protein n=1 Tax=Subtercola sp. YIM 133946 TaxID=3118909 RepID=UPI002F94366B
MDPLRADPLAVLRKRTSVKWRAYPDDVLPLFVAEMDYPLAAPVKAAMVAVIESSDLGYIAGSEALAAPYSAFAAERWGWQVDAAGIRTTTDVSVAAVEALRQAIEPGDAVVIMPPVYPPFYEFVAEAGGVVREVALLEMSATAASPESPPFEGAPSEHPGDAVAGTASEHWMIDLAGLERALAEGATAVLLCNPQNPLGVVHSAASLERVAELAQRYGAMVVSDEIHAPLVYDASTFTPFLSVSAAAREVGFTVTSASKGWNLAGAKCALIVAQSERILALVDAMPAEVVMRTSQLGLHGSVAAFADGVPWLDSAIAAIEANSELLAELLAEHLPGVVFRRPQASYLGWLDFTALGWGDDPSIRALVEAKVALMPGPDFGPPGRGFVRLNFACSPEVLTEAVLRLARVANADADAEAAR